MLNIKIDASGLYNKLDTIRKRSDALPWGTCADVVLQSVRSNFDIGGRYSSPGSPWGGTNRWQARKDNLSHKILKKSGVLQAGNYKDVFNDGFAIGNRVEYQAVHNFGYPRRNITARPFLVVQENDMHQMNKIIRRHIAKDE